MRSDPSLPVVSGAVRVLLVRRLFHRAKRSPLRTKISAPGGKGRVVCFLKPLPTFGSFLRLENAAEPTLTHAPVACQKGVLERALFFHCAHRGASHRHSPA